MNKVIFILLILFSCTSALCQDFDNVKSRYEADSMFSVKYDSLSSVYVDIHVYSMLGVNYSKIYLPGYCDYGNQPYEIWNYRDTIVGDSQEIRLPPVIGITKSLACQFMLTGISQSDQESISVNNMGTNAYTAYTLYGIKFLFWYFCDKNSITID